MKSSLLKLNSFHCQFASPLNLLHNERQNCHTRGSRSFHRQDICSCWSSRRLLKHPSFTNSSLFIPHPGRTEGASFLKRWIPKNECAITEQLVKIDRQRMECATNIWIWGEFIHEDLYSMDFFFSLGYYWNECPPCGM